MEPIVCISRRSKKKPTEKCVSKATMGDFCAKHRKTRIVWVPYPPLDGVIINPLNCILASEKILRFWKLHGRRRLRRSMGPFTFVPEFAENDSDLLTLEKVETIPLTYRFSYNDSKNVWIFDIRFFVQLIQHGSELKNPFNQLPLTQTTTNNLQKRIEILRAREQPIIYVEEGELTPEQIWNQKVLDVFLKMNSLGFPVNLAWFDMMTVLTHERFYTQLYNIWNYHFHLSDILKETMVPGHSVGRAPLFRWTPEVITARPHELKWWRKQSLTIMNAFLNRGQDPVTQSTNVLTILTALANCHRHVAEAFPWLMPL
jgi:hypothetical protein